VTPLSDPAHPSGGRLPAAAVALALLSLLASLVPALVLSGPAATADTAKRKKHQRSWSVSAPRDVRAVATSATSLTVTWREPRRADRYRIHFAPRGDARADRNRWTSRDTFRLKGLEPGTRYVVRVRAVDERRKRPVSAYSSASVLRTDADTPSPPTPPAPEEPTPSSPPSSGGGEPLWGANYSTLPGVDESIYDRRAKVARIFFQSLPTGKKWSSDGAVKQATADGIDTFVISWKERDVDALRAFLRTIPDDLTIYACFHHEPENDAGRPGSDTYRAWSTEWKQLWAEQSPVIRAEGFIPTSILMAYTLIPASGRKVSDWTPPPGAVDVFAFDGYLGKHDPEAQVARMSAAARAMGVRTGLAETGSPTSDPDRADKLRIAKRELAAAGNFEWAIYWNSALNGYDSRLDAATADIWFG
jgi:hypothetical protein